MGRKLLDHPGEGVFALAPVLPLVFCFEHLGEPEYFFLQPLETLVLDL
jgi:hypothetical protein